MKWSGVRDKSLINKSTQTELLRAAEDLPLADFTTEVREFEFTSYGKSFTQVAIILSPSQPLIRNGKRVVMAASEGGHDNGREFIVDYDGQEAIGPWLARRGITFIALVRIGRWNFFTKYALGSWIEIPLHERAPIYSRTQGSHFSKEQYEVEEAGEISSSTGSLSVRIAKSGSELKAYMIAATPHTVVKGFREALQTLLQDRDDILLLYWGFSTGGPYMWALAKFFRPDGISGYGMTNNPLARFAGASDGGKYSWLYEKSSCRIRERGKPDFLFYASGMTQNEIDRRYENCLHSPRFKSTEDTFMFFNIAALTETIMKLWRADFLPAAERTRGLAAIIRENLDLCFPDDSLNQVNVLELYGTEDEIMLGTKDPTLASTITAPYCKNFKMIFLEGLHHCTDAKHSSIFGAVWLDAIMDDYFNS